METLSLIDLIADDNIVEENAEFLMTLQQVENHISKRNVL